MDTGVDTPLPGMPDPRQPAPSAYESAVERVQAALIATEGRLTDLRKQREQINAEIKVLVTETELLRRMSKVQVK